MGKPSSSRLTKTSNHSMHTNNSTPKLNHPINSKKKKKRAYWAKRKKNDKIKEMFENLRKDISVSETSISVDDSIQDITVIPNESTNKRKMSCPEGTDNKRLKSDDAPIVIIDDSILNDDCCIITPKKSNKLMSSTPYKSSVNVQQFCVASNNNDNCVDNLNSEVINLTKQINDDSFLTIDLTGDSFNTAKDNSHSIALDDDTLDPDCKLISIKSNDSSLSGESDVTVLRKSSKQLRTFKRGIAKMNSSDKGKLLELIMQNIFVGCSLPESMKKSITNIKNSLDCATETVEAVESQRDLYIKEVIVGEVGKRNSRNSVGSNIYHPDRNHPKTGLRMVVIDGSNVAMEHGKGKIFSVKGLKICIDYFLRRGHVVKSFVPRFRCKFGKSSNPRLLDQLERQGLVTYTPSREIQGRLITSYDDRYIVQTAAEFDGVIVSGDNYRDLMNENAKWRTVIETRLLPFTWVNDMIMFPKDPLGRYGPTLENFLKHPPPAASSSNINNT
ncbi:hypothetical protein K1T71_012681 [Dendrolimus kikuchii]|uniref:Uncharacterized protein n=1 Tax=Dendrolimus kikuchii TaxID=765133 RepID=A0ACC1CK04_9NEOP|nr:hypothetical protein K1T71_012681 [Dendrolimus kikuchii]